MNKKEITDNNITKQKLLNDTSKTFINAKITNLKLCGENLTKYIFNGSVFTNVTIEESDLRHTEFTESIFISRSVINSV